MEQEKSQETIAEPSTKEENSTLSVRDNSDRRSSLYARRDFFSIAGWGIIAVVLSTWFVSLIRYMFPRVLFEPPKTFKAGYPEEYTVDSVSTRWVREQRVWIIREKDMFYALLAVCTHLGCTPIWLDAENKFKCPCHGSGFYKNGVNYEGPAPRALERVKISLAEDGQLLVDKGVVFVYEKDDWDKQESYLKV